MQLLKDYFALQKQIFEYFDYVEDWRAIPLSDETDQYWFVTGEGPGDYWYSPEPFTEESIRAGTNIYGGSIYTQRFLPKWVYRGPENTMVCADTHTDGNKFLMVFANAKECKDADLIRLCESIW